MGRNSSPATRKQDFVAIGSRRAVGLLPMLLALATGGVGHSEIRNNIHHGERLCVPAARGRNLEQSARVDEQVPCEVRIVAVRQDEGKLRAGVVTR